MAKQIDAPAPSWVSLFAGIIAGVGGVAAGQPFDVIKTRLQTANYSNGLSCAIQTVKEEGIFALYKGMFPPMVGTCLVNAVLFFSYDFALQQQVQRRIAKKGGDVSVIEAAKPTMFEVCVAAWIAGFVQCFVSTPFEALKVRLQCQKGHSLYSGTFDCGKKVYRQSGIRGIYKGLVVVLYRDVPSYAIYFGVYEKFKDQLGILAAGGLAGSACWASIYPLDVIKSRIQLDSLAGDRKYTGILDCAVKSFREGGFKLFLRGFPETLVRGFVVNAATFFFIMNSQLDSTSGHKGKPIRWL